MEGRGYRVTGRVQGVGFRWWAASRARALGLRGWVRNVPDGSVDLEAWGPLPALLEFERELSSGPRHASVDAVTPRDVDEEEGPPLGFSILA